MNIIDWFIHCFLKYNAFAPESLGNRIHMKLLIAILFKIDEYYTIFYIILCFIYQSALQEQS